MSTLQGRSIGPDLRGSATKILVVDRDVDVCAVVTATLEELVGAAVTTATTDPIAMAAMSRETFNLALIDVPPGAGGLDIAECAANHNIPVLLTAAHPDTLASLSLLGCPYLPKPFCCDDLVSRAEATIAEGAESIRRVRLTAARLSATRGELRVAIDRARALIEESQRLCAFPRNSPWETKH